MTDTPSPSRRPWLAFAVVATVIYLTLLDLFIVNVAIGDIAADFPRVEPASLSWVLTGYAIVFAAVLVPAGRYGDLFGRRAVFLGGLAVFVVGSALAVVASSFTALLVARIVQAVGAAGATPNSLAVLLPMYEPRKRPSVIAAWGTVAALGAATGPPLGGVLASADWRWIFAINLPLGLLCLALTPHMVEEFKDSGARIQPDLLGALAIAGAIGLLALGLSQAPEWGWADAATGAALAGSGVLFAVVARRSVSHPSPIVDGRLVRSRPVLLTLVATMCFWAAFAASLLASGLFLARVWSYSVLEVGLAMFPGPGVSAVAAVVSARAARRFGTARTAMVGSALAALGCISLATLLAVSDTYAVGFLPGQLLIGVGSGLLIPNLMSLTLRDLPAQRFSTGVALYTVSRQIGAALGVAGWIAVTGTATVGLGDSYAPGWWLMAVLVVVSTGALAVLYAAIEHRADAAADRVTR